MTSTIEEFNSKIEELKKRLKEVSIAQNTLSKLNSLLDYFDQIQEYLNAINIAFSEHIAESEDYSENITNLQTKVEEIEQTLSTLPDFNELDLTQMQEDISTLKTNLSTLKGSSNSSISNLESQIATIQADISTISAQISTLQSNISKNSSDISTLKTTTQNHSTTLTNLTSSQNTLSSTVSNINNRLTSAESELSAITGGVDLTDLNDTVKIIQTKTAIDNSAILNNSCYGINYRELRTEVFMFCSNVHTPTTHSCTLNYESIGEGTLTIKCLTDNNVEIARVKVDLSKNPHQTQFSFVQNKEIIHGAVKFRFNSTTDITYINFTMVSQGSGIMKSCFTPEYYFICFDNKVFVTKKEDTGIKYGCFSSDETINLASLSNFFSYQSEDTTYYTLACYMPYTIFDAETKTYTGYYDGILAGKDNRAYFIPLDTINTTSETHQTIEDKYYKEGVYDVGISAVPCVLYPSPTSNTYYIKNFASDTSSGFIGAYDSLFVALARNNNQTIGSNYLDNASYSYGVGLRTDGYFYFKYGSNNNDYLKLNTPNCTFATLYAQPDGSFNAYLSTPYTTYKYKISKGEDEKWTATLSNTIKDCNCIYETYNNKIVKHLAIDKKWEIATLIY